MPDAEFKDVAMQYDMIEIACPLCGRDDHSTVDEANLKSLECSFDYLTESPTHYRIVRCNHCGMEYSNPILTEQAILDLYKTCKVDNCVKTDEESSIRANMKRYVDRLAEHSGISQGRLLDIGCGCGHLLEYASQIGFDVAGIDPGRNAVDYARKLVGSGDIREGAYKADLFPDESFDLITCIHVIDHVVEPKELIATAARHLKKGGHMFIATHNMDSWLARMSGKNFIAYSIQHIGYFTPELLSKMAEECGLTPVTVQRSLSTYTLNHYAENGFRSPAMRKFALGALKTLRMGELQLSFPFGNMELTARKD